MLDSCEPITDATDGRRSERDGMSQQCSYCGDDVPGEEWHPVTTVRDDDGDVEIHTFCSEACRAAWEDGRDGN